MENDDAARIHCFYSSRSLSDISVESPTNTIYLHNASFFAEGIQFIIILYLLEAHFLLRSRATNVCTSFHLLRQARTTIGAALRTTIRHTIQNNRNIILKINWNFNKILWFCFVWPMIITRWYLIKGLSWFPHWNWINKNIY